MHQRRRLHQHTREVPAQRVGERKIVQKNPWPRATCQGRCQATNSRDVHIVYGGLILTGKPWTDGSESFHTWLEDSDGLIYDQVSPQTVELGDICGADTSRVENNQRFVGVSREEIFSKFGVWYETHPAGGKMQDRPQC